MFGLVKPPRRPISRSKDNGSNQGQPLRNRLVGNPETRGLCRGAHACLVRDGGGRRAVCLEVRESFKERGIEIGGGDGRPFYVFRGRRARDSRGDATSDHREQ